MKSLNKLLPIALLLGAVTVQAQTGTPAAPAKPAAAPAKATGPLLSGPQMKERATGYQAQVTEDSQHMRHLQQVARDQKDVIKLTCVNDKLVEMKASMNMFDSSYAQFQGNVDTNSDAARPSFTEIQKIANDLKELRGQADACIGTPDLYKQESDIEVHHPDFPDNPTGVDPFGSSVETPGYASPFS